MNSSRDGKESGSKNKVKFFSETIESIANGVEAFIEKNVVEKEKMDQHLKSFFSAMDKFVKERGEKKESEKKSSCPENLNSISIKIKKCDHFKGDLPCYHSEWASGFDIRAQLDNPIVLKSSERTIVPTGLSFSIPPGYEIQVRPRSGWALKEGITLLNSPGTIDADYRGEVKIILINLGQKDVTINDQERIAQFVLCPVFRASFLETDILEATERGDEGFGSTGRR